MRKCARAIILNERNQLLVFERIRRQGLFSKTHHYYSIPGGGIEQDETPAQAVVRELQEEMQVTIEPLQLLMHQIDQPDKREHYYYLARIAAGTPVFNPDSEEARARPLFQKSSYSIAWVGLDDPLLGYHGAYKQAAAQVNAWLQDGAFPIQPVDIHVKNR